MDRAFENIAGLIARNELDDAAARLTEMTADGTESRVEKLHLEGRLREGRHEWADAVAKYREVLDIDADHSETLFRLASLLDRYGEDEEAMQLYEQCVHDPPTHVNALLNLAILYEDHDRYEEARDIVHSIVNQCPNHTRARMFLKDIEASLTMYYDEERELSREKRDAMLDTPVGDFELSVRSRNCLKQMDIHTLGDLLKITEAKLLAYKNFGETSLNEIKAMLSLKGLKLGQGLEEPQGPALGGAEDQPAMEAGDPNILYRSVAELELSVRSRKCLQRLGITTLAELTQRSEPELLSIKNFGQTSLSEIKRRLSELGLSLRDANQ